MWTIHYRCDDGKKKSASWEATLVPLDRSWDTSGDRKSEQERERTRSKGCMITRVTDMQVCHDFLVRHNQLPAKPPCRQQIELTFLWRSLPFANCRVPLWQKEGFVDASIGIAIFFMATCGRHLGQKAPPLFYWRQRVEWPVGGASRCFLLLEVNLDEMPPGEFFWKPCHMI